MKKTTQEDRNLIEELVKSGFRSSEIALRVGWSVKTVEKWRLRIRQSKTESLMGRPKRGALSQFSESVCGQVKSWRNEYEGWGSKTIKCEFSVQQRWQKEKLPSSSTIYRYLKQECLVKKNERHQLLPHLPKIGAKEPHDLWQMDGQGNEWVNGVGVVSMLNVKDVVSGIHVGIYPAHMKSERNHPSTSHYQTAFRLGAIYRGLPKQVQTDHASVFYDSTSKSPFPTLFSLWLIALGIEPVFSRTHIPQDQGKVERSHQTAWGQVCRKSPYRNWLHFFEYCQQRCAWLNEHFPSTACGNQPPLSAHPNGKHSGRAYHPSIERELLSLDRVYDYLEKGKWWRIISKDSTLSLGGHVYYLAGAKPKSQALIRFRKSDCSLLISLDNELCFKPALKGLTLDDLIGNTQLPIPGTQLELPFNEAVVVTTTL